MTAPDHGPLAALYARTLETLGVYLGPTLTERQDRAFRRALGAALVEAAELGRRSEQAVVAVSAEAAQ